MRLKHLLIKCIIGLKSAKLRKDFKTKSKNCYQSQVEKLKDIVEYGKNTTYGREHHFGRIESIKDFQKSVPINNYETLRPYIEKQAQGAPNVITPERPLLYGLTSGTTDKPKWVPITPKYFDECYKALSDLWIYEILRRHPEVLDGKDIAIASRADEKTTPDGTPVGSISGHLYRNMPKKFIKYHSIPLFVFEIPEYISRYYTIARIALAENISFIVSVNPSSLVELNSIIQTHSDQLIEDIRTGSINGDIEIPTEIREKLRRILVPNPKRAAQLKKLLKRHKKLIPKHYWPKLATIATWRCGNSGLYLKQLEDLISPSTVIREFGYMATEIRAGIVFDDNQISTALACHLSFFEFVKVEDRHKTDPEVYLASEVELGRKYYIIVTTAGGLYRYDMNDIVRVDGFYNQFPMITFIQKGEGVTSLTGEKLHEEQLLMAVSRAEANNNIRTAFFVGYADIDSSSYHLFVEFNTPIHDVVFLKTFREKVDSYLREFNVEYEAKRGTRRLKAPSLFTLTSGSATRIKTDILSRGKQDGQFKHTYLTMDLDYIGIVKKYVEHEYTVKN